MFAQKNNSKKSTSWSPILFLSLLVIFLMVYFLQYTTGTQAEARQKITKNLSLIKEYDVLINELVIEAIVDSKTEQKKQTTKLNSYQTELREATTTLTELLNKKTSSDFLELLNSMETALSKREIKVQSIKKQISKQQDKSITLQHDLILAMAQDKAFREAISKIESKHFLYVDTLENQADSSRYVDMVVIIFMLLLMLVVIYRLTKTSRSLDTSAKTIDFQQYALDQHAIVSMSNSEGDFIYVNDKLSDISGYSKEELLQQNYRILLADFHPVEFYDNILARVSAGNVWHGEVKSKAKNGECFWVNSTVVPLLNAENKLTQYISIRTDITQQKNIQLALDEQKNFLNKITDTMAEGVYVQDQQGNCTYLNSAAENMLGWPQDEMMGKSVHDTIHTVNERLEPVSAEDCPIVTEINLGNKFESDKEVFVRQDGSIFPVSISVVPIIEGDQAMSAVGVFRDISQRKAYEEEIARSKEDAIAANKAKSRFLANMSHEIRTPMNAIIGMSYLALEEGLAPKQADYIKKVHKSAENLLGIINDILDFSKIEAEKTEIEREFFQLSDVLEQVLNVVSLSAQNKAIELIIDVDNQTPNDFFGDALRLRQVLTNLLSNAIKFTEKGDVIVSVSVKKYQEAELILKVDVKDTGIGMNENQLKKLFNAFQQADESTTRKFGGTGLGLVISKNLVALMGGELSVKSQQGVGSTFSFHIKLSEAYETQNMSFDYKTIYKKRILIIDNSDNSREILSTTLSGYGMEIETASTAVKALSLIENTHINKKSGYDLILLDWKMAEMDGIDFLNKAQYLDAMKQTKIIMLTAQGKESLSKELGNLNLKIAGVLAKPVIPQLLLKGILRAFNNESLSDSVIEESKRSLQQALDKIKGCHLLLVEDHEFNQQVALDLLSLKQVTATVANNGEEALALLKENAYDGILMDCQMPVMDGYAATELIRKQKKYKNLPIIAMTANVMAKDIERVLTVGMNDHISKPINVDNMVLILAKWVTANVGGNTQQHRTQKVKSDQKSSVNFSEFKALKRLDNNELMYQKLLQSFYQKQQSSPRLINEALKAKNLEQALLLTHTIKGITSTIGAEALEISLAKFENCIKNKEPFKSYLLAVVHEFKQVNADLRGIDWDNVMPEESGVQADNSAIKKSLNEILVKVENFDAESEESIAALMAKVDGKMKQQLEDIREPISQFDFSTAEMLLVSLINTL